MYGLYVDEAQRYGMGSEESVFGVYSEWLLSAMDKVKETTGWRATPGFKAEDGGRFGGAIRLGTSEPAP